MKILKGSQGIALVMVIMVMVILLSITGASLLFSSLNLKTATNVRTGSAAIYAADAGIQHALAVIPWGTDFDPLLTGSISGFSCAHPCNGIQNKPKLTGSISGYSYTVVAENDTESGGPTDDSNRRVILTSTATGPNSSSRKIRAYIGRSSVWTPPGAIYLPGQPASIETVFSSSGFTVNGNDTNPGGDSGPASPVPGVATSDSGTTNEISGPGGSLDPAQYFSVTGQGTNPSVVTTSSTLDVNLLANNLIALGVEGVDKQTLGGGTYSSGTWGTSTSPKITRITGDATLTGGLTAWGVVIVDGNLVTRGDVTINGLLIVRGDAKIQGEPGDPDNVAIYGAVLIYEAALDASPDLTLGKQSRIFYSSQTINTVVSNWGSAFSTSPKLIAWSEVVQ